MATKRTKDQKVGFGLSEVSGLPLVPGDRGSKPTRGPVRAVANVLDTALLVLVVLVALAVVWWLVSAVIGTVLFFVKLAALAVVLAVLVKAWMWARRNRGR